jgi:uncharacterized radical SAM superfamily Fe-S cluster-containing enzyme
MERLCPLSGRNSIKIASDYRWYAGKMFLPQKINREKDAKTFIDDCPKACGLCECHSGTIYLPVFSITNVCNLDCNICFTYNRMDKKYFKSVKDTKKIIENILDKAKEIELINLTGGEPTLHPGLFDILEVCNSSGIGRITMNTNGIRIAEDYRFAEQIKQSGVQLVLSLNTFDPQKSVIIHGKDITQYKKLALEVLESLNIPTTILCVCIKGVNEQDVADIVQHYLKKRFVRSITIQNMTFTGKGGRTFKPREHITIDEVEKLLASREEFSVNDFFPLGSYHPLCYSVAYYIVYEDNVLPLSRIIDRRLLTQLSENSYLLDARTDFSTYFKDGIDRLWAEGEDERFLKVLRRFITKLYPQSENIPPERRRRIAEGMVKMIYIHSHMDEDNFDISRVSRCGDIVPDESGQMIPACSYNLLYRQQDPRFWVER